MENVDTSLVDWSRAQFALTAMYHWLFVPLTLGLSFIMAFMETMYVRTGDIEWKKTTKFWMTLFAVNFAIGAATGLIMEFEFGTNWSNYSWFVGDIFGAPLAVEGIVAFFMESVFFAVMFFGWNKVSKNFHLLSTWLVAIGSSLSALWILVANAWMQRPVGMKFNPDSARNEMEDFWAILFSPVAIDKFTHTVLSSCVLASVFVVGVSAWFLLKNREIAFAKRSIKVASIFGLTASILTAITGDSSGRNVAKYQPMKFAAMENLYYGQTNAPLALIGFLYQGEEEGLVPLEYKFKYHLEIPDLLSYMVYLRPDAYIPGIYDLINGNKEYNIMSATEKATRGKIAITALREYQQAKQLGNDSLTMVNMAILDENFPYFGYGYYEGRNLNEMVPNIPLVFYSFRIMVGLGMFFLALFAVLWYLGRKDQIQKYPIILQVTLWSIPLAYIASMAGWVVAESGRQPWVIQDLLPTIAAVSQVSTSAVQFTFWLFFAVFTGLLLAEIKIMLVQIKKGPEDH